MSISTTLSKCQAAQGCRQTYYIHSISLKNNSNIETVGQSQTIFLFLFQVVWKVTSHLWFNKSGERQLLQPLGVSQATH